MDPRVTTDAELAVMEGRSLTVPCHYDPQYAGYLKYWCRGKMREFCTSLARTDPATPAVKTVSLLDDPVQQVFTVTMDDLKEADSGWYICGVEVGGGWTPDVVAHTYIKVVHAAVTRSQSAALLPPPEPITEESRSSHRQEQLCRLFLGAVVHILESLLVCASIGVLVGLALWARKLWKRHNNEASVGNMESSTKHKWLLKAVWQSCTTRLRGSEGPVSPAEVGNCTLFSSLEWTSNDGAAIKQSTIPKQCSRRPYREPTGPIYESQGG
ncbi:CMRF35-like molecule 5 [Liparis tanakae]|uniref:CMRF35-like molecule 5 n=1 Tax=Liparis tanakae TaxID=230148 RepID=A0A4Z2I9N6_9TELE|nr:CMRF35-like molecule 5 [Liparis tanakae]